VLTIHWERLPNIIEAKQNSARVNIEFPKIAEKPWLKTRKPSWFWVYFGIILVVMLFAAITIILSNPKL
jgi:hypothetical protein